MYSFASIPLVSGGGALIDPEDFQIVCQHRWRLGGSSAQYAITTIAGRTLYMHRYLLNAARDQIVDHIDGDGLNCTRRNLRIATASQNSVNLTFTANKTGFRGVTFYPGAGKFQASIMKNGGVFRGPRRLTAEEAARDFDFLARAVHGPYCTLNFPGPGERGVRRGTVDVG